MNIHVESSLRTNRIYRTLNRHYTLTPMEIKNCISFRKNYKNHLGNIRQVTKAAGSTGTVVQTTNYYPFGAQFCDGSADSNVQPYRYNGKELDKMHGLKWYDYGARMYDPVLLTWNSIDPLCEKYYSVSPYVYCMGNPVKFVDEHGLKPKEDEAARIAHHVYGKEEVELIGGWRVSSLLIDGVTLRDDRSGFKSAIYERTKDGVTEYVYATAGTDSDSYEDWKNNFLQVFGSSEQYNISKENARVLSDNINQELTFVGHSLGGGMAATNAYKTGRSAMTFNAAWVSPLTIAPWNRQNAKIDAYVHVRDELNYFQMNHGVRANGNIHWRNKSRAMMGHSIENFYPSRIESIKQESNNAQSQYMLNTNNFIFGF